MRKFNRYPQPPREYHPTASRAAAAARFDRLIAGSAAVLAARARVQSGAALFDSVPVKCRFTWGAVDSQGWSADEVTRGKARAEGEFRRAFVDAAREGFLSVPSWQRSPLPQGGELVCARAFSPSSWYADGFNCWQDLREAQKNGYSAGRMLALSGCIPGK